MYTGTWDTGMYMGYRYAGTKNTVHDLGVFVEVFASETLTRTVKKHGRLSESAAVRASASSRRHLLNFCSVFR